MMIAAKLIKLFEILLLQHTLLAEEVLSDVALVARFRDHGGAASHAPLQHDLGWGAASLLSDLRDDGVVEQLRVFAGRICWVGAAERGVGCYVDVVLFVEG